MTKVCYKVCYSQDFTKNQKPAKPVATGIYGFMCMVEARRVEIQIKRGYPLGTLCDVLGIGQATLYSRLTGKQTFRIAECYKILDWLGLPDEDLLRLFPRL